MLPVYEASAFKGIIRFGGHTKPWVVMVRTEDGPVPYVVKLFKKDSNNEKGCIENEVIGSVLAKEFNLVVPKAALIHFSNDFLYRLPPEALISLNLADSRIKFGTKLIEPADPFYPEISKDLLQSRISIDTAFAFDNLIRNRDRGSKPNMFFSNKQAYLIDHEFAFERIEQGLKDIKNNQWDKCFLEWHAFYDILSRSTKTSRSQYFDEFQEYLKFLNLKSLNLYFTQLESHGYASRRQLIMPYLSEMKSNSSTFVSLLKTLLT